MDWLLDSDPAIRWQVLRDLVHTPAEAIMRERARIAVEGWGSRLLALQGEDYDVLRALEYFRSVGRKPDARTNEAIALLRSKQQPDGTWLLENTHPGKVHFALEDGDGRPSRWNTLRALRVLTWCEQFAN